MVINTCTSLLNALNDVLVQLVNQPPPPSPTSEKLRKHALSRALDACLNGVCIECEEGRQPCECEGASERCPGMLYANAIALCDALAPHLLLLPTPPLTPSPSPPPDADSDSEGVKGVVSLSHPLQPHLLRTRRLRNQLLPPTSRLPDDLLSYIFSLPSTLWSAGESVHFADQVSHVSHRWRAVALRTPNAWSTILVGHTPLRTRLACQALSRCDCQPRRRVGERRAGRGKSWISLAKAVPLSFDLGPHARVEAQEIVLFLLDALEEGPTTVRSLGWALPSHLLLALAPACTKSLSHLSLQGPLRPGDVDQVLGLDWQALRSLELRDIVPRPSQALGRCTRLSLLFSQARVGLGLLLQVLSGCGALEELRVGTGMGRKGEGEGEPGLHAHPHQPLPLPQPIFPPATGPVHALLRPTFPPSTRPPRLLLPRLHTLSLRGHSTGLLGLVRTPSLCQLAVDADTDGGESTGRPAGREEREEGKQALGELLARFITLAPLVEKLEIPCSVLRGEVNLERVERLRVLGLTGRIRELGRALEGGAPRSLKELNLRVLPEGGEEDEEGQEGEGSLGGKGDLKGLREWASSLSVIRVFMDRQGEGADVDNEREGEHKDWEEVRDALGAVGEMGAVGGCEVYLNSELLVGALGAHGAGGCCQDR